MADLAHAAAAHVIAQEVLAERDRQDQKWGEQNHPDGTFPDGSPLHPTWQFVQGELHEQDAQALAEAAMMCTNNAALAGAVTWRDILLEEVFESLAENDPIALRTELIQVSAVAQQWVEAIDRRRMDEVHAERAERRP